MVPTHWKVVVDATDPHAQADFWAAALGYEVEDNSPLIEQLLTAGAIPENVLTRHRDRRAWRTAAAVRHPDDPHDPASGAGLGRRLLFNQVPEPKPAAKNRLHLDLHPESGRREEETARLAELGATVLRHVKEQGGEWTIMADPEGNEFCVH